MDLDIECASTRDTVSAWLLEASAGTGKTHQLTTLYLRLVVECGLEVRRILAITFTNAATAELRDRVRRRLREALDALDAGADRATAVSGGSAELDLGLAKLDLGLAKRRLELALRDFDQAAISTIHGFSQRTLQDLAFESGQDLDLELLADGAAIQEQLVDDALAEVFASASLAEVEQLERAGWTRKNLLATAKALCGPREPLLRPESVTLDAELAELRDWLESLAEVRRAWTSDEAGLALDALVGDNPLIKGAQERYLRGWFAKIVTWLKDGAPHSEQRDPKKKAFQNLRRAWFSENWTSSAPPLESRPWWPLIERLEAFLGESEVFFAGFSPVAAFAATVRGRYEAELQRRGQLTFDAMLSRLADAIGSGGSGAALVRDRLRSRYDAVFVDEFQDTDDAQWTVLREAFLTENKHLFLIGDPKQAIYAFRGADVNVYLRAARELPAAAARRTMRENYRSDPDAVEAMNVLWRDGSRAFGVEEIDYVRVEAKRPRRLEPRTPGLRIRWLDGRLRGQDEGTRLTAGEQHRCAELAADEVQAWLEGRRARLVDAEDAGRGPRRPRPSDLAVLVNRNAEAASVRVALARRGIPSVAASKDTVFETSAAGWLVTWLRAVASGGRDREARAAALTPIAGWTPRELAWSLAVAERGEAAREEARAVGVVLGPDRAWDAWTERLAGAAERWKRRGFAHALEVELGALGAWPRILRLTRGERHATDLRHLFELLHAEQSAQRHGPARLADWLAGRARVDVDAESLAQRLESDANAVRIETVHLSKGLEYPIVLLPFAWWVGEPSERRYQPLTLRGPERSGEGSLPEDQERAGSGLRVDLRAPHGEGRAEAVAVLRREEQEESLRKLYVGLTRALHHTVAWWGPVGKHGGKTDATALGRLLMRPEGRHGFDERDAIDFDARQAEGSKSKKGSRGSKGKKKPAEDIAATLEASPSEDPGTPWERVQARLNALVDRSGATIAWEPALMPPPGTSRWTPEEASPPSPEWPSERAIPHFSGRYRVSSYSSLARGAAASDRDEKKRADSPAAAEVAEESPPTADDDGARVDLGAPGQVPRFEASVRLQAGSGTRFGTFVHEVLERLDFPSGRPHLDDERATLDALLAELGGRHGYGASSPEREQLRAALPFVLQTPLGSADEARGLPGLPAGFTLAQLSRADRLDELSFDLALGAGTRYVRGGGNVHDADRLAQRAGCVDPCVVYDALEAADADPRVTPWLELQRRRREAGKALVGSLVGVLTGSIDLAFRVVDPKTREARYFVADYKTNRIEGSTLGHFTGPWLDWKMQTSGYLLQSLLYTLALHRHLRVRLGDAYSYETCFGGALYLFVRGMVGPDTPTCSVSGHRLGVHAQRWPAAVIEKLDEALAPTTAGLTPATTEGR